MPHRRAEWTDPISSFRELCNERGLAVTHQRQIIYTALRTMAGHPSPEAVYECVREQIPSLSLATVYKTIHTFIASGLLREASLHHGSLRIEANLHPHHHLVCHRCRTIVDVADEDVEPVRLRHEPPPGFTVERYAVEGIGLCTDCARSTPSPDGK